jgi:hypothetical protein
MPTQLNAPVAGQWCTRGPQNRPDGSDSRYSAYMAVMLTPARNGYAQSVNAGGSAFLKE